MKKMITETISVLSDLLGESNVKLNEPMSEHTSFRVGGPADLFLRVNSLPELQQVLAFLHEMEEPYFVLGRGTNLLVGDRGYRGCIITMAGAAAPVTDTSLDSLPENETSEYQTSATFVRTPSLNDQSKEVLRSDAGHSSDAADFGIRSLRDIRVDGTVIYAGAGTSLSRIAGAARDHGLSGLEFASGIPGSLGGALVMNAGAYDGSMDQVIESAALLLEDGTIRKLTGNEMRFGYRRSILKDIPAIALQAAIRLIPADSAAITAKMRDLNERRREKQPLEYPSAGSTFKRPEGLFAGKLIMDAGLRGFRIGGAAVSEKHCGFVINQDHASAADILRVIETVQQKVYEKTGVHLEKEVICLGEF